MIIGTGIHILGSGRPKETGVIQGVSGGFLWYAQDSVVLNGSNVSQWTDKTGLGHHMVQATPGSQPEYKSSGGENNLGYVQFDDANEEFMTGQWSDQAQPIHGFAMAIINENSALTTIGMYTGYPHDDPACSVEKGFNTTTIDLNYGTILRTSNGNTQAWSLIEWRVNGANSYIRMRNLGAASGNAGSNNPSGGKTFALINGVYGDPCIAEYMEFDHILAAGDITTIRNYFGTKYNVSV